MIPGQHIFISGRTGSGKSTLTKEVCEYFPRLIIFDRKGDWANEIVDARVYDFNSFSSAYRQLFSNDHFRIVIQFQRGTSQEALIEHSERIINLCFANETRINPRKGIGIVFEEVWLYGSVHSLPIWQSEIVLTGRSECISFIGNAQRPASVHKNIPSQCEHLFIGQIQDVNDMRYFREIVGDIPELRTLKKFEFLWCRPGEKPLKIHSNPLR